MRAQWCLPVALLLVSLAGCRGGAGALPVEYRRVEVPRQRLEHPATLERGRALYLRHCALCHGENADGQGLRRNLSSRPIDFTDPAWRRRASERRVFFVIREGMRGTAMAAWKVLDEEETWDLVAYVLSVGEPTS